MASRVRLADGRELTVMLAGKRVIAALSEARAEPHWSLVQLRALGDVKVWVNPAHVSAVEDRPELG